jgi:uncharacterized protein YuzE
MKLHYYPETDSLYIELSAADSSETRAISKTVNVDFDANGGVVGIDIDPTGQKRLMDSFITVG